MQAFWYGFGSLFCFGMILGVVAMVKASNAIKQIDAMPTVYSGKGYAVAGFILGLIGTLTWIAYMFS